MDPKRALLPFLTMITLGVPAAKASEPRMTASGTVVDNAGRPVAGAIVQSFCIPPGMTRKDAVINDSDATGSDGSFVVRGLPAGTCRLRVEAPWAECMSASPRDACSLEIRVRSGVNVHHISLKAPVPPAPAGSLSGRIVDTQDTGLPGHRVVAACSGTPPFPGETAWSSVTGADGAFRFARLAPGTCRLRPEACEGGTCTSISVAGRSAPCAAGEACLETLIEQGVERTGIVLRIEVAR